MIDEYVTENAESSVSVVRADSDSENVEVERKPSEEQVEIIRMKATAYTARCEGCSGITASGYDVRNTVYSAQGLRIVAAPRSIPFGTVLRIKLADGTSFKAVVLDRGGAITEGRLDYLVSTYDEAIRFGRQAVEVEVLGE